jgi:hypothetical protein
MNRTSILKRSIQSLRWIGLLVLGAFLTGWLSNSSYLKPYLKWNPLDRIIETILIKAEVAVLFHFALQAWFVITLGLFVWLATWSKELEFKRIITQKDLDEYPFLVS